MGHRLTAQEWRHTASLSHTQMCHVLLCPLTENGATLLCPLIDDDPMLFPQKTPCCSVLSCSLCYWTGVDITEDGAMLLCPLMCCVLWDMDGHHRRWRHAALSSHVLCAMGQGWTSQRMAPCCSVLSCYVCYGTWVDITGDGAMLLCPLMFCVLWDRGGHHRRWRHAALSSHVLCAMRQGWTSQKMAPCCSVLSCSVCYETGVDITEDGAMLLCPLMCCVLWDRGGHHRGWRHAALSSHVMCAMGQGWTSQRMAPCCFVLSCAVCYGTGVDITEDGAMLLCPLMLCVLWDRGGHHRGWRHAVLSSPVLCSVFYGIGVDIMEDGAVLLCPLRYMFWAAIFFSVSTTDFLSSLFSFCRSIISRSAQLNFLRSWSHVCRCSVWSSFNSSSSLRTLSLSFSSEFWTTDRSSCSFSSGGRELSLSVSSLRCLSSELLTSCCFSASFSCAVRRINLSLVCRCCLFSWSFSCMFRLSVASTPATVLLW